MNARKPPVSPDLFARFAAIVGERYAVTDPAMQEPYLIEMRGLYHGHTPLVLRPGSVDEVAAILALANETRTAIVPQGGNTGLVGGQIPHDGEILLSLNRLDRIREVDATSNTMTAEAGVSLAAARKLPPRSTGCFRSARRRRQLHHRRQSLHQCGRHRRGRLWHRARAGARPRSGAGGRPRLHGLSKLKKDNTGYDLKNLFIGAEGTLGVITAAVLRMIPRPRSVETAFVGVASPAAALALLGIARERAGGGVTAFELMLRLGIDAVLKHDSRRARSARAAASLVRADRAVLAGARGPARRDGGDPRRRRRARPRRRRRDRRNPRSGEGVLAHARDVRRGAAPGRRLDQARRLGAGRAGAGVHARGEPPCSS